MTGSTMQNVWCGTRTDHSPYNMYGGQPAEIFFLDTSYSPIKRLAEMTEYSAEMGFWTYIEATEVPQSLSSFFLLTTS